MGQLDGKVVAIAGTGGIGDEIVRRCLREGAKVVFGSRGAENVDALSNELAAHGDDVVGTRLDGAEEDSVDAFVALAKSRFGRLDGFHCNFTITPDGYLQDGLEIPMDVFDESIRVNLRGYFLCARAAVPAMIETGGGSILFTSTAEVTTGSNVRFAYGITKAGIQQLMRHTAVRYGPQGVRANAIAPGMIAHHKFREEAQPFIQSEVQKTMLKSRPGCPNDIAAMAAFLMSDDAGFVTGQVISVDGGLTRRA